MKTFISFVRPVFGTFLFAICAFMLAGCDAKTPPAPTPAPSGTAKTDASKHDDHGHEHAAGEKHDDHGHAAGEKHDDHGHAAGGAVIELGSTSLSGYELKATRDEGALAAGGEAPIDVTITGSTAKIAGVRFWIGTQDAKGSMKAKAEIEDPKDPNRWHTHAEIPNPMPAGSKLWVEIESEGGAKAVTSFDLKP